MRIMLTVHQFLPEFSSGTEILALNTAKRLRDRGHRVFIFTAYPSPQEVDLNERFDSYEVDGLPVRRFKHTYSPALPPYNIVRSEYENTFLGDHFSKCLDTERPDVVHFFHLMRLSGAPIAVCSERNLPMVFTPTDFWIICPTCQLRAMDGSLCTGPDPSGINCLRHVVDLSQPDAVKKWVRSMPDFVLRLLINASKKQWCPEKRYAPYLAAFSNRFSYLMSSLNKVHRVLAPTRLMMKKLEEYGLRRNLLTHLPYGLEMNGMEDSPKKFNKVFTLGFIGTLSEHKGVHVLVDAVRLIPKRISVAVKIYGKPEEFPEYVRDLERRAEGDARIEFCGTFPNSQIGEVFSEVDVLVVPSVWYENTPLVLYSAQATKTPVIGSDIPGIAEVIEDGKNGFLFEMGDSQALSKLIMKLLGDPRLKMKLSYHSKRPQSMTEYVERLEEIYMELGACEGLQGVRSAC